jgi:signal transduction histidine kinase
VSDAPSYLPPYARSSRGSDVPMKSASVRRADDLDDDADADDLDRDDDDRATAAAAERAPVREGLPPTYRMRHEPHYVETLAAPAVAPAAPVVPVTPVPVDAAPPPTPEVVAAPVDGLADVIAALATSIEAIQASLRDLPLRGRPLRERVAIDLARAEAARTRWIADAAAVLRVTPLPSLDEVDLVTVCGAVAAAFAPEYRLAGGEPSTTLPAAPAQVFGDERLLTTAVGSVLSAVRALIEDRGDAGRVSIGLAPRVDTTMRTLEITQSAVRVPASAHARFFDPAWTAHPAGAAGAVLLAAARRIAEAHGGGLELAVVDGGGCRFSLSLPAAN